MHHLSLERWRQIDTLFAEALERPMNERSAFLRYRCGGDPELYEEIVALLKSDAEAESELGESATEYAAYLIPGLEIHLADSGGDAPERVGPYYIRKEIGRGGMGAVYLAERAGDDFDQRVAVKVVKRGMDTDEILRRFRHERRILASLNHPNIARLLDGGVMDDGRPYLTMDFVEGVPIDRYCDARRLTVEERLRLFEPVCEAVQYAHRNLVVHRDLKPSNILVSDDDGRHPQIKLLDFGIAKLLEADSESASPVTRTGVRVMTPAYAAPEQMSGEPVTTATDIYALGIILYKLLTGRLPYEGTERDAQPANLIGLAREPDRPSVAASRARRPSAHEHEGQDRRIRTIAAQRSTTPERLRRQLRGDIDTILLKALRREPERRYTSAEQLLEDIRRHLSGRPVEARPDTIGYRTRKFVRRHVLGVTAAAAFVMIVIGFGVAMAVQQAVTARARDTAETERDKAERVVQVFAEMLQSADPGEARGDTVTVVGVLSRSRDRVDSGLDDQPEVQATMYNVLGRVYASLGQYDASQEMLEKALSVRTRVLQSPHPDLIETVTDLAKLAEKTGEYDAAESYHLDALAMHRKLNGPGHPGELENLSLLASLLYRRGQLDHAAGRLEELLATNRSAFGDRHEATAKVLNDLGAVLKRMEKFDRSEPYLREAQQTYAELLGDDHPQTLSTRANYASLLSESGNPEAAEPLFRDILATRLRILGADHPDVALTLTGLAVTLQRLGAFGEAEVHFRRALEINRGALSHDHPTVGMDLASLAGLLQARGEMEQAGRLYEEALDIFRTRFPPQHPAIAYPLVNWGRMLLDRGEFDEALPLLREGFEIRSVGYEEGYWGTAAAQGALGACLAKLGRYAEAEPLLTESYGVLLDTRGSSDRHTEAARQSLFELYGAWNKPEKAVPYRPASR